MKDTPYLYNNEDNGHKQQTYLNNVRNSGAATSSFNPRRRRSGNFVICTCQLYYIYIYILLFLACGYHPENAQDNTKKSFCFVFVQQYSKPKTEDMWVRTRFFTAAKNSTEGTISITEQLTLDAKNGNLRLRYSGGFQK
jgi:hypothetical protein